MKTEEKDELNLITLAQQYSDDDKARELPKDTPLSLHGMKYEDALRALLKTPPPPRSKQRRK